MTDFSQRLAQRMQAKGMSQSDLARAIWGSNADGTARNRDRISSYLQGRGLPTPENLEKLAKALDCKPDDLVPGGLKRPLTRKPHDGIKVSLIRDRPGWWRADGVMLPEDEMVKLMRLVQWHEYELNGWPAKPGDAKYQALHLRTH